MLERLVQDRLRRRGPGAIRTVGAQTELALCHIAAQRYADAEPLLLAAYDARVAKAQAGPNDRFACRAAAVLSVLYTLWGMPEPAAEWQTHGDCDLRGHQGWKQRNLPTAPSGD